MMLAGGSGLSAASTTPAVKPLPGSTVPFTRHTWAIGAVAAGQRLTIQVWLRPRVTAAESYASAVSTPGSASFRHYLSPDGYASRFGAPAGEAVKVGSWLRSAGFTGVRAGAQRAYVRAGQPG
jgi:subtilase family serine protease